MSQHFDDRGHLVVDDRDRPRQIPTLQNIREGLLLAFHTNPPESQWSNEAKALQTLLMWSSGDDVGERRQRHQAALESVSYNPDLMQTIRHYVRKRFGEWDPGTLIAVHDWLVARHGFSAEAAWVITAPKLLEFLTKKAGKTKEHSAIAADRLPPPERIQLDKDTQSVVLDGVRIKVELPKAFVVYAAIVENRPQPLTREALRSRVRGIRGSKTVRNLLDGLPDPLKNTIISTTSGYHFDADGQGQKRQTKKKKTKPPKRKKGHT